MKSKIVSLMTFAFLACQNKESKSEVQYAQGSWALNAQYNLLFTAFKKQNFQICTQFEDQSANEGSSYHALGKRVSGHALSAAKEWLSKLSETKNISVTSIFSSDQKCHPGDFSKGRLLLSLYNHEQKFMDKIYEGQNEDRKPTLGGYDFKTNSIVLNVPGITNPNRDPQEGRRTLLHEFGHIFGMDHSAVLHSVMTPSLANAPLNLTADDLNGLEKIVKRISKNQAPDSKPLCGDLERTIHADDGSVSCGKFKPESSVQKKDTLNNSMNSASKQGEILNTGKEFITLKVIENSGTYFKDSEEQAKELEPHQKCAISVGTSLLVHALSENTLPSSGHVKVTLGSDIDGCDFGKKGTPGYLYTPHFIKE